MHFSDLTIFSVIEDLHVFLFMSPESSFHLSSRVLVRLLAAKEVTTAMFLNQFRSTIPCQLTKPVVAINNRKISHLSVTQDKVSVRYTN